MTKAAKDSLESAKKQVVTAAKSELQNKLFGSKDSTGSAKDTVPTKKKLEETGKGLIKDLFGKKKKDTTKG